MADAMGKKALYTIVNVGFADEAVDIIREAGAKGATIINARGTGATHVSLLGISIDTEKEIILSVVDRDVAVAAMRLIKEKMGRTTPACGICFTMPVEQFILTEE